MQEIYRIAFKLLLKNLKLVLTLHYKFVEHKIMDYDNDHGTLCTQVLPNNGKCKIENFLYKLLKETKYLKNFELWN